MNKTIIHIALLLLGFFSSVVRAQEPEYIRGRLLDAKTGEPIVFASIRIKGRALGVISNADGGFKIPLKYRTYGDTLEISSMGYKPLTLQIKSLTEDVAHTLTMRPGVLNLQEAVVRARKRRRLSARQIVRRAIRAIPDNYPVDPFAIVGYYRDYQLDSLGYVNLNEAILEVFDKGFHTIDSADTRVRMYAYEENTDFRRDSLAATSYDYASGDRRKVIDKAFLSAHGGNEFNILRVHDALRNYSINSYSFVHRLKSDILEEHRFFRKEDTYFEGEPLYTVQFSKVLLNYSAYGTLFIAKNNFAIHKMEYAVYDRRKKTAEAAGFPSDTDNRQIFEITTAYREQADKMYLNYISFHNRFQLWDPPKLTIEYVIPDFGLKCFVIRFSDKVDLVDATTLANYEATFKGRIIPLRKAELLDSQDVVYLYPGMYPNKAENMLRTIEIAARKNRITPDLFEIQFRNIQDMEGNVINTWTSRGYNQFREFFPQEIKPNHSAPADTLYMKKAYPMFGNQPIIKPDNFGDYWMNTPLKSLKE